MRHANPALQKVIWIYSLVTSRNVVYEPREIVGIG